MAQAITEVSATANTSGPPALRDMQFAKIPKPLRSLPEPTCKPQTQRKQYSRTLLNLTQAKERQHCQNYNHSADEVNYAVHDAASIDDYPLTLFEWNWFHNNIPKHFLSDRSPMLMHVFPTNG
jgi:hypothetical protein